MAFLEVYSEKLIAHCTLHVVLCQCCVCFSLNGCMFVGLFVYRKKPCMLYLLSTQSAIRKMFFYSPHLYETKKNVNSALILSEKLELKWNSKIIKSNTQNNVYHTNNDFFLNFSFVFCELSHLVLVQGFHLVRVLLLPRKQIGVINS